MSTAQGIFWTWRHVEKCMGTVFTLDVRAPGSNPDAIYAIVRWLHWADATFSTFQADSEINRLARGELTLADCSPEVRHVLQRCEELETETDGYFSAYATGRLDPSGFVKGWAIEHCSNMLRDAGSLNHCVNGGGDVQCIGSPEPGRPWRIGIANPQDPMSYLAVVTGHDFAVATSGSAQRGQHIASPHRTNPLASISVYGPSISLADAYATTAYAMGTAGIPWIETLADYRALAVFDDGTTRQSANEVVGLTIVDDPTVGNEDRSVQTRARHVVRRRLKTDRRL